MRIAQIIVPDASEFEKKCQRTDFAALAGNHEIVVSSALSPIPRADLAHVYGHPDKLHIPGPYVASAPATRRRLSWRRLPQPAALVSPEVVPEAVEERYFQRRPADGPATGGSDPRQLIGSLDRPAIRNLVEQTMVRLSRFRDDVTWNLFEHPPSPEDLWSVNLWVDPAVDEEDHDGFVAEAVVAGTGVVAARTAVNVRRLEKGRTGFLVPLFDSNELTHAILTALFKPEVAMPKIEAGRQTAGRFHPRQRGRVLERIYSTVIR